MKRLRDLYYPGQRVFDWKDEPATVVSWLWDSELVIKYDDEKRDELKIRTPKYDWSDYVRDSSQMSFKTQFYLLCILNILLYTALGFFITCIKNS